MRANNGEGMVFEFVTTGLFWQMLEYDGASSRKSNTIVVVLESMDEDYSVIVECIYAALINGEEGRCCCRTVKVYLFFEK